MKIVLSAIEPGLAHAWRFHCSDLKVKVEILEGTIFGADVEALVSPANSFGFMDGGIDWTYSQRFGWSVQAELQNRIKEQHDGELLVGQATMLETGDKKFKYLIATPTMRVPMELHKRTINIYLATRAALLCAKKNNISSIAFPGMGTGVGKVPYDVCGHQMREAIDEVICGNYMFPITWDDALQRHAYLLTGLRDSQIR